jgi:hypothetical protein
MHDAPLWATAWLTTMFVCVGAFCLDALIEGYILDRPPGIVVYFIFGACVVAGLCCIMMMFIALITRDRDG